MPTSPTMCTMSVPSMAMSRAQNHGTEDTWAAGEPSFLSQRRGALALGGRDRAELVVRTPPSPVAEARDHLDHVALGRNRRHRILLGSKKLERDRLALHPESEVRHEHEIRMRPADRKSTRLNSSHLVISYAVFCLKKKKNKN